MIPSGIEMNTSESATSLNGGEQGAGETIRPVRVAFVLHVMQVAGAEVLVSETIRRLGPRIVPFVYCLDAVGPLGQQLVEAGVPVVSFGRRPGFDRTLFGRLAASIKSDRIEVIHAHQYTPFFYAAIAAKFAGARARVIFTEHGRHFPDAVSWRRRWANRLVLRHLAHSITAVCRFSAEALATKDGFPLRTVIIVPNGIEFWKYQRAEDRQALQRRLGLHPDRRHVTIVARFHPVKDHATLVRAFSSVAASLPDVDLLLVGDGPLRGAIETQARELHLADRVKLVGIQSNVSEWLHVSDVFVLSSLSEAASITLLEAMACGLPVVVTAVGGNPELVRHELDGLLVPRGDAEAMADCLSQLLHDPMRASTMGQSGRRRVMDEFQIDTTIARYAALYDRLSLLGEHTESSSPG